MESDSTMLLLKLMPEREPEIFSNKAGFSLQANSQNSGKQISNNRNLFI
jgi:hypothetical protein